MVEAQTKNLNFFKRYKLVNFKKGELLINPDTSPKGVFLIKTGKVRIYTITPEGVEMTMNIFKPYAIFPIGWVLNNRQDKYYYQAISETEAYLAPKQMFNRYLISNKEIMLDLLSRIYVGLEGYFLKIESLISGEASIRVATHLLIQAKRFGKETNSGTEIKYTQTQIASESGLSRETVAREIKKLKVKGLLYYKLNKIVIKNLPQLEQELFM